MLTNFFGKSKPITILVILALFLCYFIIALVNNATIFKVLPSFLLLLAIISFINSKNDLSFDNSYVFLFSVVLIGIFPDVLAVNAVFYSNLTILLFLRKIYSLQSSKKIVKKLFDAGLWLGISFLIEPFSLVFIILLYLSIFIHQHVKLNTLLIPIIGLITPLFLYFTYCFWYDKTLSFYLLFDWFTYYDISLYSQPSYYITISLTGFFIFISLLIKTPKALSVKNNFRRSWILIILNFTCALILLILIKDRDGSEFLYLIFPSAIIIANAIEVYEKKWFSDIAIALAIICSLVIYIF